MSLSALEQWRADPRFIAVATQALAKLIIAVDDAEHAPTSPAAGLDPGAVGPGEAAPSASSGLSSSRRTSRRKERVA